jgi:hypothetical protein
MKRAFLAFAVAVAGLTGCAQSAPDMSAMMKKPAPPPELQSLAGLIGNWTGEAEFVSPKPEEPAVMKGSQKNGWALDGMAFRSEGMYEMPGGEMVNGVETVMWDAGKKKFRAFYNNSWGEMGVGWWDVSDDGKSIHVTAEGVRPDGSSMSGSGSMRFVDADTIEWEWSEGGFGGMKLKGVTRRAK